MPITLGPISRRRFLASSAAAAAGAALLPALAGAAEATGDAHTFALVSDTHIDADVAFSKDDPHGAVRPWDNFAVVAKEITAAEPKPAGVLITGDCARLDGKPGDYASLVRALEPLRAAGLPVHLVLGNHDHRANFLAGMPKDDAAQPVADKHVLLIESPRANLILLDSLEVVDHVPGLLGADQLAWLAKTLDARADKPAIVMVHHQPEGLVKEHPVGLRDHAALLEVLRPRKQAKALFFGHTHNFAQFERDGLHLVNLPPTVWVFTKGRPKGWMTMTLEDGGAKLKLHALDHAHAEHGKVLDLKWR